MVEQFGQLTRRGHACLVYDQHTAIGEPRALVPPQLREESRDARAVDASTVAQLSGGATRHGDADDCIPRRLPGLPRRPKRVGLPRPGLAGDDRHPLTAETKPLDDVPLLGRERRARLHRATDVAIRRGARARTGRPDDPLDETPLEREVLGRRVAHLVNGERHQSAVAAPEGRRLGPELRIRQQRDGTAGDEELIGSCLQGPGVSARARRQQLTDLAQHLVPGEGRRAARQSVRTREGIEDVLPHRLIEPFRGGPTDDPRQLLLPEAKRLSAPPPLCDEIIRTHTGVLGATCRERRRFGRPGARGATFVESRLDLRATPAELPQHGSRNADDLGDPLAYR
jgi:hypothetical protein